VNLARLPTAIVTHSTSEMDLNYEVSKAVDNNPSTSSFTLDESGRQTYADFLWVDLGAAYPVTSFSLRAPHEPGWLDWFVNLPVDLYGADASQPPLASFSTGSGYSAGAIRSWALQATPWDNMGAMLPVKEMIGLMSFNFDLIIPGADTIWTQTIERTDEDIADLLFATPYQYTMRHRFPKPPGV
jgi:hypothetical protein